MTRTPPPTHQEWQPLPYMLRAVEFLCSHRAAGLPLKPGGRKTSITLAAFQTLQQSGKARTMLVVAPLRVCRQTWRQEAAKWSQFRHLEFALLHGPKKNERLKSGADIYLINPEGIAWLAKQYMGRSLPFDICVIDELTKFQNAQAGRHKALRPRLAATKYRWGLTGSLFAKGHMSVFGQQLILDDGACFGRYITHYRDKYFQVGYDGFSYDLLPGAEAKIVERMAPYWFQMDDADYAELPGCVDVPRIAEMGAAEQKIYDRMKRDMIALLPEGELTAANAGACYSKLAQMANGAVYMEDRSVAPVHDLKLEMLDELLDELDGEPLLIGYEFQHDIARLKEWYFKRSGKDLPYLGKGTTSKQEDQWVRQWNANELEIMAMHPQSAAHGLNMQEGQARNTAWFSITWDWELYDQFIRRVRRSGNHNEQVFNHILIIKGTIDEQKLAAVRDKDFTEGRLNVALRNAILREAQDVQGTATQESMMVAKLSRPDQGNSQPAPQATQPQAQPTNAWGAAPDNTAAQRERIQEQIAPQPDRAAEAQSAFTGGVAAQAAQIAQNDYGATGDPGQPTPPEQPANNGWGAAPQQEQPALPATQAPLPPATQAPPPPANNGWGAAPAAAESQAKDRPVQGGWADPSANAPQTQAPTDDAPFDADVPTGGMTEAEAKKLKKDELVQLVVKLTAGGATVSETPSDGRDYVAQIEQCRNRATVLAAVVASSPDSSVEDIVEAARELMDFVERG